ALVRGGELLVPKRKSARADGHASMATCAVVRLPERGRLAVVGLGPGARDLLTPRARAELRRASVLVGLDQYVDQIRDLLRPGTLPHLRTPWEVSERRVRAAAEADLVVTFYNPRSRGRDWQLPKALAILAEHREPATPVGVVRNASRPDESSRLTTLASLDP